MLFLFKLWHFVIIFGEIRFSSPDMPIGGEALKSEDVKSSANKVGKGFLKGLKALKTTFVNRKFIEFCLLGCVNCFNDSLFSWRVSHVVKQKNIAQIIGYLLGLTTAFLLTCKFIFKAKPDFNKYIKFLISYIPNFVIYFLFGFLTLNYLDLGQFWGTFLAATAGGPITFVIIKLYAFGKPSKKRMAEAKELEDLEKID